MSKQNRVLQFKRKHKKEEEEAAARAAQQSSNYDEWERQQAKISLIVYGVVLSIFGLIALCRW